jgi:hypothetical protein
LLYKLSTLQFSICLIKIISSSLSERKFRVWVDCESSTPRDTQVGVSQDSVLSPTLYTLYINDRSQTPGVYLGLFAYDTCIYVTDRKESYVFRKLQRDLSAIETWCESSNIKINDYKTQAMYFFHWLRPPEAHLTLNWRNISFVNHVICDKGIVKLTTLQMTKLP